MSAHYPALCSVCCCDCSTVAIWTCASTRSQRHLIMASRSAATNAAHLHEAISRVRALLEQSLPRALTISYDARVAGGWAWVLLRGRVSRDANGLHTPLQMPQMPRTLYTGSNELEQAKRLVIDSMFAVGRRQAKLFTKRNGPPMS